MIQIAIENREARKDSREDQQSNRAHSAERYNYDSRNQILEEKEKRLAVVEQLQRTRED